LGAAAARGIIIAASGLRCGLGGGAGGGRPPGEAKAATGVGGASAAGAWMRATPLPLTRPVSGRRECGGCLDEGDTDAIEL
jgi:hypothetical protein